VSKDWRVVESPAVGDKKRDAHEAGQMIGRRQPPSVTDAAEPRGFDDFDLRIGDVMRGERATMGKSLLDVQRELKIKATYIAAIENADVSAFETTGFIAGYVRSYARYLGLDPEWTFETFCAEADFTPLTGIDKVTPAKTRIKGPVFQSKVQGAVTPERDPIAQPRVSFAPAERSPLSTVEPRAIGSLLVLFALIGAIGYGGWAVLKEVQRVTVTPVESAPDAVAQVDPLDGVTFGDDDAPGTPGVAATAPDALDRLYRPQALETPVMVARDGPIAALDPSEIGALAQMQTDRPADAPGPRELAASVPPGANGPAGYSTTSDAIAAAVAEAADGGAETGEPRTPQVTENLPEVMLVAVRPAWVRVRASDGTVLLERILEPGDSWAVPATEAPPSLRTGAAGAVYFAVNGETYGPAGPNGAVVDQIALTGEALRQDYAVADVEGSPEAREAVAVAEAALSAEAAPGNTDDQ
jgi:cytoskeletal protein RodZ